MKLKKYPLVILSILLILLIFVSSASAADTHETDILSIDESANPENNLLTIDNNVESNKLDNNTLKASNDEILTAENNKWYVNGSKDSEGDGSELNPFKTLNKALTNSELQDGDTIMIASGEYKGTDNTGLIIGKNLNFIKDGDGEAIFNAEASRRIWTVIATSINITGLTFKNGNADNGGAIYFINDIYNSNINATFINNIAAEDGGANYFRGNVAGSTVSGTYSNNKAGPGRGGANYFYDSVSDSTIGGTYTNNKAEFDGGANFFNGEVSDSTVTGTYTNNTANGEGPYDDVGGGANYFYGNVTGSTITGTYTNNTAENDGGANFFNNVSDSTITGTYTNNTATQHGGANNFHIYVSGSNVNGTYTNNNATNGGANYFHNNVSDSTITGTYTNNTATQHGGANYFTFSVSNSNITGTYTNNTATWNGGANYFWSNVSDSTIGGTYTNNKAKNSGGANYFWSNVSDSTIGGTYTNNNATNGGANYINGTLSGSTITGTYTNNKANGQNTDDGGGANYFHNEVSYSTVTGTYTGNNATSGGANFFINYVSNSTITGTYTNNTATKNGGANIFIWYVKYSNVTGTYTNNTANIGGANYFMAPVSNSNITGTYTNNTAKNIGGANYVYEVSDSTISGTYTNNKANGQNTDDGGGANYFWSSVSDSTITGTYINNTATKNGGANYFYDRVSGSTVTGIYINNTAPNSIIYFHGYGRAELNVKIKNAIFLNNNCPYEISTNKTGVVVENSWFGNNASNYMNKPKINENITMDNWLFLNATVSDSSILIRDSSNITFKLKSTDGTNVSDFDNSKMPVVNLTLTATKGNVDKTTTLDKVIKYMATEKGRGSVTAKIENAQYTVYLDNSLRNVNLSVSGQNITYLENETLTLTYNNTATGKINITLKSKNYNKKIERDINRTITIEDLPAGDYDVTVEYLGDNVFLNDTAYTNFTVNKMKTEVIPDKKTIDLYVDNETKITYTLKPEYVLGKVSFTSNDSSIVSVNSTSGDIHAEGEGTANITVIFSGNENYTSSNATITINVKKIPTQISFSLDLLVGSKISIATTLTPADAGNVTFTSSDKNIVTVDDQGNVIAVGEGNATITVSFAENKKYLAENKTISVIVQKVNTNMDVSAGEITVGENATISITLPSDATGNVTAKINGKTYTAPVKNGKTTIIIPNLSIGNYNVPVTYSGDYKYNSVAGEANIIVNKANATMTVDAPTITVGENATITVTLPKDATGNVNAKINSKTYTTPVKNGKATITIPNLSEGNYNGPITYSGNHKYNSATGEANIIVNKANATMTIDAPAITVGENATITVTLPKDATGNVNAKINSKTYTTPVKNGKATITIPNLSEGYYSVTVTYSGDHKYNNSTATVMIVVNPSPEPVKKNLTIQANSEPITVGQDAKVIVTDLEDATGNITVTVNGKTYTSPIKNSKATITIPGLTENETAYINYAGDENYNPTMTTINITVNPAPKPEKKNLTLDANAEPITIGDDAKIIVTDLEEATGDITVTVNGKTYTAPIKNSETTITIPGLKKTATADVIYPGDENYNNATTTVMIVVNPAPEPEKKNLTIQANAEPITIGDDAKVIVTGLKDATGDISVIVNGKIYTAHINNGEATITIPGLTENETAYVNYAGDKTYNPALTAVDIVVYLKNATISIDAPEITEGENATVTVTLPSDATGHVTIGDKVVSVKGGVASAVLTNLPVGNTTVSVTYSGDDKYNPIETEVTVSVKEDTSDHIIAPDVTKYYSGPERFVVNVTDYKGNPLADKTVKILINGREYTKTTDANGTASIALGLPSKTYNVTVTVDNQTVNSVVTILPTINATDVVKMYKNGTQYYATFLDSEGKYLADGTTVKFNINGVFYERKVSGDKGLAKLNINLPPGEYVITATNPVTGENAANKVTVLATLVENRDITKYYKNSTQYTVKVLDANGNPVGAGKTVTFNINGVMYQRQTNESGIAKLNINLPPGEYTITASYEGYNVANNITVLPILSASDLQMKYMDGSQFKATLLDGQGNPFPNKNVTFNINGVYYNRQTDSEGVAKLNIRLPAGEYIITSSYNGCNIANKITIRG